MNKNINNSKVQESYTFSIKIFKQKNFIWYENCR